VLKKAGTCKTVNEEAISVETLDRLIQTACQGADDGDVEYDVLYQRILTAIEEANEN